MKKLSMCLLGSAVILILTSAAVAADQEWIRDILERKDRYWNTTVTVIGQVTAVKADPEGTTRGTYQLRDESTKDLLTVATNDLPPVGRTYSVTGVILQAPENAAVPYLKETKRSSPGLSSTIKLLLYGGGLLFLVLLLIFIVLLLRPRAKGAAGVTVRPGVRPGAEAPGLDKTKKVSPAGPPAPAPDKTQVYLSLGADLIVEKGPDRGKEFSLHKQVTTIGRPGARKNDVELADDTVSKEQASIFYDNVKKSFSVRNESTTNTTLINKNIITEAAGLNNGDLIEMGKTVFRFKQE
ncbi:MAG: FHA domain-containing protein [Candidatus Aminicenantales bacterium]